MTVIGRFYVTETQLREDDGLKSVSVALQSSGPIDLDLLRVLLGVCLEIRSTDWGIRARGVKP